MFNEILNLFTRGGWMTIPILIASACGLTLYIERLWFLTPANVIPESLQNQIRSLVRNGKIQEAMVLSESNETPFAIIVRKILEKFGRPYPYLKETAEEAGRAQVDILEKHVESLSTIIAITPLMGLLGTVIGMIDVFQVVADKGVGSPMDMASGIWEALLSTAFGLSVAIVALVGHRHISSRISRFIFLLEKEALILVDTLDALSQDDEEKTDGDAHERS